MTSLVKLPSSTETSSLMVTSVRVLGSVKWLTSLTSVESPEEVGRVGSLLGSSVQSGYSFLVSPSSVDAAVAIVGALSMRPSLPNKEPMVPQWSLATPVMSSIRFEVARAFATADIKRLSGSSPTARFSCAISAESAVLATLSTPIHAVVLGMVVTVVEGLWLGAR